MDIPNIQELASVVKLPNGQVQLVFEQKMGPVTLKTHLRYTCANREQAIKLGQLILKAAMQ